MSDVLERRNHQEYNTNVQEAKWAIELAFQDDPSVNLLKHSNARLISDYLADDGIHHVDKEIGLSRYYT